MFRISSSNSKLGTIVSINLPAGITCPSNAPCNTKGGCYAKKGRFCFKAVKAMYKENLDSFVADPKQAEQDILSQLPLVGFCRIHASGDFFSIEYLEMIVRIAKIAKHVKFMAFTKNFGLFNEYMSTKKLPSNLKIIYSGWYTDDWVVENPYNLPVAHVYDSKSNNPIPSKAIPCGGQCDKCFVCWNLKKGQAVVFEKH